MTKWMHKIAFFCLAKQNRITEFIVQTHVFQLKSSAKSNKKKKQQKNSWPASDGFRVTVIFLQIQLGALDLKETDNCTTHFMWQPCTSPARQRANIITVTLSMVSLSAVGTHPEINDVHSMNLMDQMSPRLWVWVQRGSVFFFFFFFSRSEYVYVPGPAGPRREETVGEACPFQSTLCPEQN